MELDEKSRRILTALKNKRRPYRLRDVSSATGLSKAVVDGRCRRMIEAGLIDERWVGAGEGGGLPNLSITPAGLATLQAV